MPQYRLIDIFTSEDARWNGRPIGEAMVQTVADLKIAARCHVMRGVGGCYENGEVSTQRLEVLSYRMPLHIEIVAPASTLGVLLPKVEEMVTDGIVALRNLEVISCKTGKVFIHRHIPVKQIMTPSPQKAFLNTPVSQVVEWLLSAIFTGIPVVDTEDHPRGIITQSDLIYRAGMPVRLGLLAKSGDVKIKTVLHNLSDKLAKDIMTAPAIPIEEDRMLTDAVDLMLQKNIKRLPVVDTRGKLVGMLSRLDVFRSIMKESPDWNTFGKQDIHVENLRFVSDIMRRDSHTVSPDTSVEDVTQIIGANDIQRIAVVDASGRFLGLIFDSDILAVFSTENSDGIWDYLSSRIPFTEKGRRYHRLKQMLRARAASDIMNSQVVTIQENALIDDAIQVMVENGFKRLPVLDNQGMFRGMISRDSLLRNGFADETGKSTSTHPHDWNKKETTMTHENAGIHIDIPGSEPLNVTDLLLDFTGTLSCDGVLIPGVAERLKALGNKLHITVLTADTFGTAEKQLDGLPVHFHRIQTGTDKEIFISGLEPHQTAAIGNGRNDIQMVRLAGLGIAVVGPEGCAGGLVAVAKVVCRDILDALDLLQNPLRIKATLRE